MLVWHNRLLRWTVIVGAVTDVFVLVVLYVCINKDVNFMYKLNKTFNLYCNVVLLCQILKTTDFRCFTKYKSYKNIAIGDSMSLLLIENDTK